MVPLPTTEEFYEPFKCYDVRMSYSDTTLLRDVLTLLISTPVNLPAGETVLASLQF